MLCEKVGDGLGEEGAFAGFGAFFHGFSGFDGGAAVDGEAEAVAFDDARNKLSGCHPHAGEKRNRFVAELFVKGFNGREVFEVSLGLGGSHDCSVGAWWVVWVGEDNAVACGGEDGCASVNKWF